MENGIITKLLEFQKEIQAIKKDAKNPHFKNTYASLNQILSEVKPLLSKHGLFLSQPVLGGNVMSIISDDVCGQIESSIPLPTNLTPQQLGSAITYFRRYTISGLLSLETEDDDGQHASVPPKPQTFDNEVMEIQKATNEDELKQIWAGLSASAKASKDCTEAGAKVKAGFKK